MTSIFTSVLLVVHVAICLLLCLVVLMQRPKQEGLGAAFGGGMTDQAFGARTTDVLQKGTVYLGTLLFIVTLALSVLVSSSGISKREDAKADANLKSQVANADADLPANPDAEGTDEDTDLNERIKNEAGEGDTETPKKDDKTPAPAPVDPAPVDPAPAPTTPEGSNGKTSEGALIGAAVGGIIGHQSGKGKEGAAIGAAVGGAPAEPAQPEQPEAPAETPQP